MEKIKKMILSLFAVIMLMATALAPVTQIRPIVLTSNSSHINPIRHSISVNKYCLSIETIGQSSAEVTKTIRQMQRKPIFQRGLLSFLIIVLVVIKLRNILYQKCFVILQTDYIPCCLKIVDFIYRLDGRKKIMCNF